MQKRYILKKQLSVIAAFAQVKRIFSAFQVANAAVLRLTKEAAWIAEALAAQGSLREGDETFVDR